MAAIFANHGRLVESRPAAPRVLVFSPEVPIHAGIEALEQFNRDTRLLVPDQAWWRANPLGMLWPQKDAAFVTSSWRRPSGQWSSSLRGSF